MSTPRMGAHSGTNRALEGGKLLAERTRGSGVAVRSSSLSPIGSACGSDRGVQSRAVAKYSSNSAGSPHAARGSTTSSSRRTRSILPLPARQGGLARSLTTTTREFVQNNRKSTILLCGTRGQTDRQDRHGTAAPLQSCKFTLKRIDVVYSRCAGLSLKRAYPKIS
eukprot:scaffold88365_cov27-Tisochrysis_lutea.AAC.2